MDESLICECGNQNFWFFWSFARCTKCFNEYKRVMGDSWTTGFGGGGGHNESVPELWMRRFDKEKNQYHDNWERSKLTYKELKNE